MFWCIDCYEGLNYKNSRYMMFNYNVTGVTLPLFSYGGSSLVVMMSMLGMIYGIKS